MVVSGYRSFGSNPAYFGPLATVNVVAGPNNSGKSNILRFLKSHLSDAQKASASRDSALAVKEFDRPLTDTEQPGRAGFALPEGSPALQRVRGLLERSERRSHKAEQGILDLLLNSTEVIHHGSAWALVDRREDGRWTAPEQLVHTIGGDPQRQAALIRLAQVLGDDQLASRNAAKALDAVVRRLMPMPEEIPNVEIVPAIRDVRAREGGAPYDGHDAITRLFELQNPSYGVDRDRRRFGEVRDLLRQVLGEPSADLYVPYNKETILVNVARDHLPIEQLGTGIHELVIVAIVAASIENSLVCIEEPELHLHPALQRALVNYLRASTSNQYVLTTHSAHVIDHGAVNCFRVDHDGQTSSLERIETDSQRIAVCWQLGYLPSDLVQANSVVWVEGPTDRLYLNWWLSKIDPNLLEGVHYSVMFYGGRLLSHVSGADLEEARADGLIALSRLNQHGAIMIDSDRSNAGANISATKRRVVSEFSERGFAWVTAGREVENYVAASTLKAAVAKLHPGAQLRRHGRFTKLIDAISADGNNTRIDKVGLAKVVCSGEVDVDVYDLREKLDQLADFIRVANRMEVD